MRWGVALIGLAAVIAVSIAIVALSTGKPSVSPAIGYMPATTIQYTEVRLDLPGDQRSKLAAVLAPFPGFNDQSQIQPKLNDVLDRIVRAATKDKMTYTADIQPWFNGQLAFGMTAPSAAEQSAPAAVTAMGAAIPLGVVGITDQAKATAWLKGVASGQVDETTYNGVSLYTFGGGNSTGSAVAVTDKVMLVGTMQAVKAAVDSKGQGKLAEDADFKAALNELDRDYVFLSVQKIKGFVDSMLVTMNGSSNALARTQMDETIVAMLPAWQLTSIRFDDNALVGTSVQPPFKIGYDGANRKGTLAGHLPASTLVYGEVHDVGPAVKAMIDKFRALPEAADAFRQFDQAMAIVGGFDASIGWLGDVGFAIAKDANGVIGGGLVVQPRDAAAAERLVTMFRGLLQFGGASSGLTMRDEDHNGTKVTVINVAGVPSASTLPAGYKTEFAFAVRDDVVVIGYGLNFVTDVLDAGPGKSLADSARFKSLMSKLGEENMGASFVDLDGIRLGLEPILKQFAKPDQWATYEREIRPYLEHLDVLASVTRKDGGTDRVVQQLTTH